MKKTIIDYTRLFACLLMAQANLMLAETARPTAALAADTQMVDISGRWNSQFGPVQLNMDGKDVDGEAIVSGSWTNANTIGQFVNGRFKTTTAGGALRSAYYLPAQHVYGFAEFKLDPTKTVLKGSYNQVGQTGTWVLTREKGFAPKMVTNLALKSDAKKPATALNNIIGKWDSDFGLVELESTGYSRGVLLRGKFTRRDGKVGKIDSGMFMKDPMSKGVVKLEYSAAWNNSKGTAQFYPDPNVPDLQLVGSYTQPNETGKWVLSRPLSK